MKKDTTFFEKIHEMAESEGFRAAMLQWMNGEIPKNAFIERVNKYLCIFETLGHLAEEDQRAVIRALRLYFGIYAGGKTKPEFIKAVWEVSRQNAWKGKHVKDPALYFGKAVRNQQERIAAMDEIQEHEQLSDTHTILPSQEHIMAARELLADLDRMATPKQKNIIHLCCDGYNRKEISSLLKITPENVNKQISLLRKKMKDSK